MGCSGAATDAETMFRSVGWQKLVGGRKGHKRCNAQRSKPKNNNHQRDAKYVTRKQSLKP